MNAHRITGVVLILISAASFGWLAIFGRFAYAAGIDTATLLFLRFSLAALFMVALMIVRREDWPRRRLLGMLVGMGGLGYVGQSFLYFTALHYASAGLVALLLYLYPTCVAILSALFLKSRLTRRTAVALALATLGAALTANPQGGQWIGALLAAGAAIVYAIYIVVGASVMPQVSAIQSSTIIFASAGLVYGGMAAVQGPHWPTSLAGWGSVIGITLVATIIPVTTFLAGLKRIGPTDASLLSTLEPVVTVLLAALLLRESLPLLSLLGGGLILAAVALLASAPAAPEFTP